MYEEYTGYQRIIKLHIDNFERWRIQKILNVHAATQIGQTGHTKDADGSCGEYWEVGKTMEQWDIGTH